MPGSTTLLGSLSYVGVVTSPSRERQHSGPADSSCTAHADCVAREQLRPFRRGRNSEPICRRSGRSCESLAGKSGVTIADLESLTIDSQAIAQAGFHFDVKSLNSVISELANAVAGGTSTSQAQTDFTALFSGSSVSTTTINTTFTDLVQTIQDSAVTTTDLSTVAADEAAIQADLPKLPIAWFPGIEPWLDGWGSRLTPLSVGPSAVTPVAVADPGIALSSGW